MAHVDGDAMGNIIRGEVRMTTATNGDIPVAGGTCLDECRQSPGNLVGVGGLNDAPGVEGLRVGRPVGGDAGIVHRISGKRHSVGEPS